MLALAAVLGVIFTGVPAPASALGSVSPLRNPTAIRKLAANAYVWGLAPEFVYRFLNYNTLVTAPLVKQLGGPLKLNPLSKLEMGAR